MVWLKERCINTSFCIYAKKPHYPTLLPGPTKSPRLQPRLQPSWQPPFAAPFAALPA